MPHFPALLLALAPLPIDLDGLSIDRVWHLSGRLVVASFISVKPTDWRQGRTILGAADRDDDAERGAVLRGYRWDIRDGQRVKVVGVLRVIDHPAAVVGGVLVPVWCEVRVSEDRHRTNARLQGVELNKATRGASQGCQRAARVGLGSDWKDEQDPLRTLFNLVAGHPGDSLKGGVAVLTDRVDAAEKPVFRGAATPHALAGLTAHGSLRWLYLALPRLGLR